jgi:hypothetical protein
MTKTNTLSSRLGAAATAFALTFVLISGTVTMPSQAQAKTVYVGAVA